MNTVVYLWLREDGTPYYVGIGNPRRPFSGRRRCGLPPSRDRIVVLHEGLDWEKACEIERKLISFYGRKDLGTGILRNLADGGEGVPGYRPSEESRRKISEAHSGENHYFYGKKHTEESKRKMSEAKSGENRYKISGKNNPRYISRDWYHPDFGEVLQTSVSDLVRMFPEQNLDPEQLRQLAETGFCDRPD